MNAHYPHLFSPFRAGKRNVEFKHRIFSAPMHAPLFGNPNGVLNEHGLRFYTDKAKGGVACVEVGQVQMDMPASGGHIRACLLYTSQLHAVEDLSFSIPERTTLGVVGESGCGKSTLGRVIMGLHDATSGTLCFEGEDVTKPDKAKKRALNKAVQMIFQDPYSSLDPRMCVSDLIAEPMKAMKLYPSKAERDQRVAELMDTVGLARRFAFSYPHELDGGRRQRVGIARALSLQPQFCLLYTSVPPA